MSVVCDAAARVLAEAGGPLHYREITRRAVECGLWKPGGKTPQATLNAAISAHIKHKGRASRFRRVGRGEFALAASGGGGRQVAPYQAALSSELLETLQNVRRKIARYRGQGINEQNTKATLVQPVLRALGWDVEDIEEVQREYKRKPRDKPVDYALLVLRTPRLFVEAKALGLDLSDRRWANQIMGYASVAGVEWVVMTNGDEYRIYNACAAVPVEEKLFRTVRLSEADSRAEETLALLSKDRISGNEIEVLWNAHFVDRQVRAGLEKLFSADPDPSLVRLVKKRVKDLSSKEIRASLRRLHVQFDFPVEPGPVAETTPPAKRTQPGRRPSPKMLGVSLADMVEAGILKPPLKLTKNYKGQDLDAQLLGNGMVRFQGQDYKSCSMAAIVARSTVTGRRTAANGWQFWQYPDEAGKLVYLEVARQEFLKRKV